MGRTETSVEIGKYLNSLIVQDPLFNKTPPNDFQSMVLAQQYDSNQVVITLPVSDNDTNSKFIVNGKPILPIALPHHPQQFLFPNLNNGSQFIQVAYSKEGETPSIVDIGSTYIDSPAKELTVNHIEHYDNRVLEIEGKAESLCEIIVTRLDGLEVARSKVDIKGHYTLRIEEVDENMSELLLSLIDKMHNITQFVQHIELEVQSDARNETLHFLGEDETRVVNGVLDFKEAVLFTVVEARGDFGTLSLDKSSGAYTYTQALSVARMNYKTATKTYSGQDSFEIHIEESSGNKKRQYLTFYPTATLSAPKEEEAECTISMISFTSPKITSIAPSAVKISIPLNSVSIELNEKLHIEEREESNLTNLVRPSISGQSAISFSKIRLYVQKEDTWSEIARTVSDSNGYYSLISTELNDGFHTFLTHALAPSSTISVESSPLEIVIDSSIIIEVEQECEEDVGITLSGNILDSEGQDLIEFKHEKKSLIYGDFEIEEEGSWTYTFSKTSRIDTLNENERLEESILVSTQEGDLEKLIINIYGTQKGIHLNATHKQNSCGRLKIDEVDESIEYVLEDEIGSFGRLTLEKSSGLYTYVQNISIDGLHYNKENKNYEGKELFKTDTLYFSFDVGASVVLLDGKLHINTLVPANMRIGESLPELENQTEGSDDNGVVLELEHQTDENSSMPTLKGTTDIAYSQVIVFDGSTAVGSALSDENGFYKIVTAHLGEGSHSLSVKATSPFSKEALESSSLEYVIINQEIKEETKVDTIQSFSANVFENDDLDGTRVLSDEVRGKYGTYSFEENGNYSYLLNEDKVTALMMGKIYSDHVSYEIMDDEGNKTRATIFVDVVMRSDGAHVTRSIEDLPEHRVNKITTILDVEESDEEESFQVQSLTTKYGSATVMRNGTLTYTLEPLRLQGLHEGEVVHDHIKVESILNKIYQLEVRIHGTTDMPSISAIINIDQKVEQINEKIASVMREISKAKSEGLDTEVLKAELTELMDKKQELRSTEETI